MQQLYFQEEHALYQECGKLKDELELIILNGKNGGA